jgi:hypothetical protein
VKCPENGRARATRHPSSPDTQSSGRRVNVRTIDNNRPRQRRERIRAALAVGDRREAARLAAEVAWIDHQRLDRLLRERPAGLGRAR